ncbi:hypothetical protein AMATHDRAFT_77206 [Amanita thiersii Skay4041]|uniref:Vacuolar protein-sorting-associated protein 36 n=1 Tax=Amanita thiersii Skay4041 TaxID=703135 RepID=A0A2A9N9Y4_9AGAR|nr:hypothetical protein AMATHDRAFT_77206 [Amanita thiersii Skay4041]
MALRHCTKPIDGTIPVQALLYDDEELLTTQEGVGIYEGQQKSPEHQNGTVHISTHRLFYFDAQNELSHSFSLGLELIIRTDYYAGLFTSSPKVTLYLAPSGLESDNQGTETDLASESWECQVCAYRNPPGLSPTAARVCALCGVPQSSISTTERSILPLSKSLPSSSSAIPELTSPDSIACPACTYFNSPSSRSCEMCLTELPRQSNRLAMKSAPTSRPGSPLDDVHVMKLSFRKGGDKPFYAVLKRSLKGKIWEVGSGSSTHNTDAPSLGDSHLIRKSGISGVLHNVQSSAQGQDDNLKDALKDLEGLMAKAQDMVRLAAELNEKLTASSTTTTLPTNGVSSSSTIALTPSTEPEEATFIRSSLSQLGLQMTNTPVTLDMMKDERKWYEELARELAGVLQGRQGKEGTGIMKERGIIALDEVWGGWNRARGVALIPPSTFLLVIPLLPLYTNPTIQTRTLGSGLTVLHTPPYSQAAFSARLVGYLSLAGPRPTIDIAMEEEISVSLAKELVEAAESEGNICREDANTTLIGGGGVGGAQLKWWSNIFEGYAWDGQVS